MRVAEFGGAEVVLGDVGVRGPAAAFVHAAGTFVRADDPKPCRLATCRRRLGERRLTDKDHGSRENFGVRYGAVLGLTPTSTVTQPTLPFGPCASIR